MAELHPLAVTDENSLPEASGNGDGNENHGVEIISNWPELDSDAFYSLPGEIINMIAPHTESDPAALLLQLLTSFGNVVGRGSYFTAEADRHYPNLFTVMVGATAKARKGSSWGQIKNLFRSIDDGWVKSCVHTGLSSGEGLIWAVRDAIEKTVAIKEKGRITGYQEETVDPGISDKRALILESEFASTLKVMSREGNTLSAIIRNAWDGLDLRTMTKNSIARATEPHISIVAHITKDELNRYIDSTEMGNGFVNRFLLVCVRRGNILPDGGRMQDVDMNSYITRIRGAVNFSKSAGELRRDEGEARTLWHQVYPAISEGKPGLLGAATARAEAQVMRLALIYALLDHSEFIRFKHLRAGVAIWEYCEASARFVFGESLGDPVADAIKSGLDANPDRMTRTEISDLFKRNKNATQIGRALGALIERSLVFSVREKTDRKPIERWFSMKHRVRN